VVRTVISASRRTDIQMHFVQWLTKAVYQSYVDVPQPYSSRLRRVSLHPDDIHTLVLWSKDFRPLLHNAEAREALSRYDQLFCHLTVTGLGGSPLEPSIAPWAQVIAQLPELIAFAGDARRVAVRYDPIVHWYEGDQVQSNLSLGKPILREVASAGIDRVRISFATLYGKVSRRRGWHWYDPTPEERLRIAEELSGLARSLAITLLACSQNDLGQAGVPPSRCIDGELLSALHPHKLPAASSKDRGEREECGCTPSVDIGSYQMRYPNGCRYCYANPRIPTST
jgi:hypothetical protein